MLYLIGLGLVDEKDLTLRGVEAAKKADTVYAELYTSAIKVDMKNLEKILGKKVTVLSRKEVEEQDVILKEARKQNIAFFVPGDPLIATTHSDLVLRAKKQGIKVEVVHSSSIYSAIAETGLFIYKFGQTVSLPQPQKDYEPTSPYEKIAGNGKNNLHTLVLLDIGMKANDALKLLLEKKTLQKEEKVVVCAHLGENSLVRYANVEYLLKENFGALPHSIIILGKLHFHEKEFLEAIK